MATIPNPATFATGNAPTDADWNSNVRDSYNFLLSRPRVEAQRSTTLSVPTGTWTLVTFDTNVYDTDSMHSTTSNTSRLVCNTAGLFEVRYEIDHASNATGSRAVNVRMDSAGVQSGGSSWMLSEFCASPSTDTVVTGCRDIRLGVGDYLELFVWQDSGSTLTYPAAQFGWGFSMRWAAV